MRDETRQSAYFDFSYQGVIEVSFSVSGAEASISSIIGVKQGDVLGPVLYVIYMAAQTMSWRRRYSDAPCVYRTKEELL